MSGSLKQSWGEATTWFNERPIRERVMITVTSLVLVLVVGWELAITPVITGNSEMTARLNNLEQQQQALLEQQETLTERLSSDPSQALRERLAARQARLDRLDAELSETTGKLIAPRAMVRLLQDMLVAQEKLELVAVQLLSPTPIFEQEKNQQGAGQDQADTESESQAAESQETESRKAEPLLYAHDVELVIRGGYLDVLDYVDALEDMDNRLGWVSLDYEMLDYPDNEIRIRVRTLSLDRAWLGV